VANAAAGAVVEALQPWSKAGGVGQAITQENEAARRETELVGPPRPSWLDVFSPDGARQRRTAPGNPQPAPPTTPTRGGIGRARTMDDFEAEEHEGRAAVLDDAYDEEEL
jgi:hypothetical protein